MFNQQRYQQAKKITLLGIVINAFLGIIKIFFGFIGHSEALIADGLHSFSDLISDFFVLLASKVGSLGPDTAHPYGHKRIETAFSVVLSILLMVVGVGIIYDGIHHVIAAHKVLPSTFTLIVAIISVVANELLFQATLRVGKRIHSDLLCVNAWHHRGDAFSSLVVLVGIGGSMLGFYYLDAVAAVIVAVMIIKMGIKMLWDNIKELIDTGVDKLILRKIFTEIAEIVGVNSVHQLRTRSIGGDIFVDVHVDVNSHMSVSEGHYISEQVVKQLKENNDRMADVTIHIDCEEESLLALSLALPDRLVLKEALDKCWHHLPAYDRIQKVNLHYLNGKIEVELFFPLEVLSQDLTIQDLIQQYRDAVKTLSYVRSVDVFCG